jgi:peptidoglycan/LPS O-acetylase OafA/YrhL
MHHRPASVLATMTDADHVLLYDPLVRLPDFVLGIVAGLLFLRRERTWSRAPVVAAATFILLLALLATSDRIPFALLHNGLLNPLWGLLIYALASRPEQTTGVGSAALVRGGQASYSLYVLHKPIYFWLARAMGVGVLPSAGLLAAYVGGSVALAVVAWMIVEEPARQAIVQRRR